MKLIAAVDKNWGIGYNNNLLFNIPENISNFSRITKDSGVVVMGRSTFESIGKLLPGRINIILSKNGLNYKPINSKNVEYYVFTNIDSMLIFLKLLKLINSTYVIGGGQIYEQLIDYCDSAIITYVDTEIQCVDTYLPNLDKLSNWGLISQSNSKRYRDFYYSFKEYINFSGGKNSNGTTIKR